MSSEKVSQLITQLSNPNLRMRQKAAEEIGALGSEAKDAAPYLISFISNFNSNRGTHGSLELDLCISVLRAIVAIEESQLLVRELVQQLHNNPSWEVREQVAKYLGEIGIDAKDTIPELEARFIEDVDFNVRYNSKIAAAKIQNEVVSINELLHNVIGYNFLELNEVVEGQAEAEIKKDYAKNSEYYSPDSSGLNTFFNAKARMNEKERLREEIRKKYLSNIFHKSDNILSALKAISSIGKLGNACLDEIDQLNNLLTETYTSPQFLGKEDSLIFDLFRLNIIQAVAKIKETSYVIPQISGFLQNSNIEIRKAAAILLKGWESIAIDAIDDLRARVSTDADEDVRIEAFNAVIEILNNNPKELIRELIQALTNSDLKICIRAIWELEALGEDAKEALPSLRKLVLKNDWIIVRDAFNAIKTILQNSRTELQQELIDNLNHPTREIRLSVVKDLTSLGYMSIEYFDNVITLAADSQYNEILREAVQAIVVRATESELTQKCINLLENDHPKLVPPTLVEDLNLSNENKEKFVNSLWNYLYNCQNISEITFKVFNSILLVKYNNGNIDTLGNDIFLNEHLSTEIKYHTLFSQYQNGFLIDKLDVSSTIKESIIKIIVEFTNRNHHKDIYTGANYWIHRKAVQWLKQNILIEENVPSDLYQQSIQAFKKLAFSDSSTSVIQELAKEALLIQSNISRKSLNQNDNEKNKEVLDIFQTKNLTQQTEAITNLIKEDTNSIIDLWIQWIIDFDGDRASIARITSEKIRTSKNAVIPLVTQLEQRWQPTDDFKAKIRHRLIENFKILDCFNPKPNDKPKSLDRLEEWLISMKDNSSNYSDQIRAEFERKQIDRRQLAEKIIDILVKQEIDNYALQIQKRIARQLADMSDDRFFANSLDQYNKIKEELRKHAVPALARRLPKESDIEIRESMARVLGNVGGTFAVDALAQAVVGEERTRTARQDLLAKYYLEPSKARSEEAAIILKSAVQEAKKTLWMQQWLNIATFATGMFLLTSGAIISITNDDIAKRVGGVAAGIGGITGLVVQLVKDPLNRIQNAMSNLIQAETAFTSFIWELNLNGTYIQSQYVAEGILSNEEIAQTVDRIENSMNLTMNLVSEHLNSENQGVFPRLKSLVPPISEVEKPITIYGQNLKKEHVNRLIAINHRLIEPEAIISWKENAVKFKIPSTFSSNGNEYESVWVSLFVDGIESNVLPLQILRSPSLSTIKPDNIDV